MTKPKSFTLIELIKEIRGTPGVEHSPGLKDAKLIAERLIAYGYIAEDRFESYTKKTEKSEERWAINCYPLKSLEDDNYQVVGDPFAVSNGCLYTKGRVE